MHNRPGEEMSDYLHPIWHEVYNDIELGGPEGVEYIFTKWVNPGSIRKSISEGYEFGYLEHEGERVGFDPSRGVVISDWVFSTHLLLAS